MPDLLPPDARSPGPGAGARRLMNVIGPLMGLLLVVAVGGLAEYVKEGTFNYWGMRNQTLILTQTVMVAIGAVGMTMIIISGGIDLSAGSVIALAAVSSAWIVRELAPPGVRTLDGSTAVWLPALAMLVGTLVGLAAGGTNGLLITRLKLAPFIITLGMMTFARGLAKTVASHQRIDAPVNWLGKFTQATPVPGMPSLLISGAVVMTAVLAVAVAVLLGRTRFGRHIFAVGSNEATARLCGVKVELTKWSVYALAGAMFGLAGVTDFGRLSVGDPSTAFGKELDIIAAVVIGGGSLDGGGGSVFGSLIGAMLMAHLRNLCVHLGLPSSYQEMVTGVVLVVAVAVDRLRHRRQT
jgi:ribose/xylose/arabinose/galactoside ABC-type transport system permease subunit